MDNSTEQEQQQKDFSFTEIQLHRSTVLGAGSYGKVCQATCDGLQCAAKIIHSTLFDLSDPGLASFVHKFNGECQLLSRVRHPNIVLYLGTYSDPETRLPVLLMELCDESLTKFLEHSHGSLPFHTQVNITHDVVLALVYLHTNEVIHRDLTSNNVLMIAGSRAKVTDFGMSRLVSVNPRMTPLTQCPGNLLYMSPEALKEEPSYTKKLDVFSLGVLVVQILTRLFPQPTARFRVVDFSNDPRVGKTVNIPVDESDRRSNHLSLIDDGHPLKAIALSCLGDKEISRPSAQELSKMLHDMKTAQLYQESLELWTDEERGTTGGAGREGRGPSRARLNSLRLQVQVLKQKEMKQQQMLSQQQEEFASAQRQSLLELEEEVQRLQAVIKEKEREIKETRENEKALRTLVEVKDCELKKVCQKGVEDNQAEKLRALVEARDRELQNSRRTLQAKEKEIDVLQQVLSAMHLSLPLGEYPQSPLTDHHHPHISLERSIAAPCAVRRGACAVYQSSAFITPEGSNKVYQITLGVDRWNMLPDHPHFSFGLAVFNDGCVTTIGGWTGVSYSNQLLTFSAKRCWEPKYPAMLTARIEATTMNTAHILVVAGGYNGGQVMLDTVEVLTLYTMQWSVAKRLPHPFYMASGAVCGDQIYLAGGYVAPEVKSRSVLTCSITDLVHSLSAVSERVGGVSQQNQVWREAGRLPYDKCTLVLGAGGRRLMAVGGKGEKGDVKSDILLYDTRTDLWRHISSFSIARCQCFTFAFPGDVLYIVGGEPQSTVTEVMKIVESHMRL